MMGQEILAEGTGCSLNAAAKAVPMAVAMFVDNFECTKKKCCLQSIDSKLVIMVLEGGVEPPCRVTGGRF
jgi:hypothetical protein